MSGPLNQQEIGVLLTEAVTRMTAIEENVSEAAIKRACQQLLTDILADPTGELGNKLKDVWRSQNTDPRLKGSKFAKWGFGPSHIELTYDILTAAKKAGLSQRGPSEELHNAFNDLSDAAFVTSEDAQKMGLKDVDGMFQRYYGAPKFWTAEANREYEVAVKAMDTAESGFGSQLIGAQYVGDLWMAARRLGRLFPLIDTFEMTAPTAYLPVEADLPEMLFVGESTSPTATAYTTSKVGSNRVTVSASKFIISMIYSLELEEDSIIPFVDYIMAQARQSIAHYSDALVLNGDTTNAATGNINLDDADPADTKHYLAFDGIRHAALVDVTANVINQAGLAITWNALMNLRALMVDRTYLQDWGSPATPEDLVYVCDPETAIEIGKLSEVLTVDKYGQQATVLTGEQAKLGRFPLVATIAMSLTEADGKVSTTGSNNTLGQVAAFNRRAYKWGWRRQVRIDTKREVETDQNRIFFSLRAGFGRYSPSGAASGIESTGVIRNILVQST